MNKNCTNCQNEFQISETEVQLLEQISPTLGGAKQTIPLPTHCPPCRRQRRLAWRNERKLYTRECSATGKKIISNCSPDKPYPVFDKPYWFSDAYNPLDYGVDYNFNKPFFKQFHELQQKVPRFAIQQQEPMENSSYCNLASNCKNGYFLFDSDYNEDSYYSNVLKKSNSCTDCSYVSGSELCYECVDCQNCYNLKYSQNSQNCTDSYFLESCIGVKNSMFCINLRNKEYYYKNAQLSKEEYQKKLEELQPNSYEKLERLKKEFQQYREKYTQKSIIGTQNENVSGEYISNSKNVIESYNIEDCWDIAHCDNLFRAKTSMDVSSFGEEVELLYECTTAGLNTYQCAFSFTPVLSSNNIFYSDTTYSSSNCFGCIGLKKNEYCILNKQYTKEEYEELVPRIIEHMKNDGGGAMNLTSDVPCTGAKRLVQRARNGSWGEFFPISISPFAYNETVAQEEFQLTKEEATTREYQWKEEKEKDYSDVKKIPAEKLPNTINEVPEDVLNWAIECQETGRPFKLQPSELRYYKKMNLPIPHLHPDRRHSKRMSTMRKRKHEKSKCRTCSIELLSTITVPNCETCYQADSN